MTAEVPGRRAARYSAKVAAKVRGVAAEEQVTGVQLARVLSISENAMSRRMTGKMPFEIGELMVVAEELHVPITDLLPAPRPSSTEWAPRGSNPQPTD